MVDGCRSSCSCHQPSTIHHQPTVYFAPRLRTMNLVVDLFRRVLKPSAGLPVGVAGPFLRPTGDLPSPPPWGWSRGFITTPRTCGFLPSQRDLPALPHDSFSWSTLPTWPIVALHSMSTRRTSLDGSRTWAY